MEVHENGDWLAQNDAAPHDDIANLSSGEWEGCQNPQGDLEREEGYNGKEP